MKNTSKLETIGDLTTYLHLSYLLTIGFQRSMVFLSLTYNASTFYKNLISSRSLDVILIESIGKLNVLNKNSQ